MMQSPCLYGCFVTSGGQTLVKAEFRMQHFYRKLNAAWMALCSLLLIVALCFSVGNVGGLQAAAALVAAILIKIGLTKFGHWLGRKDEQDIVRMFKRTLRATEE